MLLNPSVSMTWPLQPVAHFLRIQRQRKIQEEKTYSNTILCTFLHCFNSVEKQRVTNSLNPSSSICRSMDANPHPTTFVHADTASFKQVVQMLTGSAKRAVPAKAPTGPKKPPFKLHERRGGTLKNLKTIGPAAHSLLGQNPESPVTPMLSPSVLDFPSLTLSPVTPLTANPFNKASLRDEERAVADKGLCLHPSPRDAEPPRLLALFPLTSQRMSSASAAGSSV